MDWEKWNVYEWLENAGMSQYAESFVDNGYDTPDLCAELQNDDLTAIGVTNKKHRSVLFSKARELLDQWNSIEVTDGPVDASEAIPPAVVLTGSISPTSPTAPANPSGDSYSEPWQSYTEPWNAGSRGHANGGLRTKMKKTSSGEKPPLPPPNRPKKKHPTSPVAGKELPSFKREGGDAGLTKLQLQLKIREQLRAGGVVLSEPPYVDTAGQMCTEPLAELTEHYSTSLKLQPLDIYDALMVIWNSENSFVTPLVQEQTHPVTLRGNSTENYDEPFDATGLGATPGIVKQSSKDGSPKGSKSQTLPPNGHSGVTGNYDEPFDSVATKQRSSSDETKTTSRVELQSKTLPSPKLKAEAEEKEKKKSKNASGDGSPKHTLRSKLFRRKEKAKSQSDPKQEDKKGGKKGAKISFPGRSKDDTSLGTAQKRHQNGASPRHSKHAESSSEADDSPQPTKVIALARRFERSLNFRPRPASIHQQYF